MNVKEYKEIAEKIYSHVTSAGLSVYVIPKPGFSKTFALIGVNYGSIDSTFEDSQGRLIKSPDGVAHFLEHKLFDNPDGTNALSLFARMGASPNAFTSHSMTAYHFEAASDFEKNLEILLNYVTSPYFTDESVSKEQGIIGQEISMLSDQPDWVGYINLLSALYSEHPVRRSICGSASSIAKISPQVLYSCHRTFYCPKNMVLCVAGNVDEQVVFDMAERLVPAGVEPPKKRFYGEEGDNPFRSRVSAIMTVLTPKFLLGFKDDVKNDKSRLKTRVAAAFAGELIGGESSRLYSALYRNGDINNTFEYEYFDFPGGGTLMFGGESRDPHGVCAQISIWISDLVKSGIDPVTFERVKKILIGDNLKILDYPSGLCRMQARAHFVNCSALDAAQAFADMTIEEVYAYIRDRVRHDKAAISIISA